MFMFLSATGSNVLFDSTINYVQAVLCDIFFFFFLIRPKDSTEIHHKPLPKTFILDKLYG